MKVSCLEAMFGEAPLAEKFRMAKEAGFDGIDLLGDQLGPITDEARELSERTGVEIATVYGRLRVPLVAASAEERLQSTNIVRERLRCAARVGAARLIIVPIFGEPRIELDWPGGIEQAELAILAVELRELATEAEACQVSILLEPLNRKETHLLRSPRAAAELVRRIGSPFVATMADTYHMDLEGQDPAIEFSSVRDLLRLVHVSDRDRALPGHGGIDFGSHLSALKAINYAGYLGFECRGVFDVNELRASVTFVRGLL
jgi:sugar phosphate isomerase/epimerase